MKFDELDTQMRVFETTNDLYVLPGIFMVARVDGRSFTRLTKEVFKFEAPFDPVFRDHMVATLQHLMQSGLRWFMAILRVMKFRYSWIWRM